ncbi:MAG: hypothetical protein J6S14_22010 [Clostridia bacterium]|nr:hypothetical protein [Clostridia bacterium]
MEWIPVIVAIVTGVCSVLAVVISNAASNAKVTALLDKNQTVFETKVTEQITQLRTQVEKHNSMIERVYRLETNDAVQDAELRRLQARIGVVENVERGNHDKQIS